MCQHLAWILYLPAVGNPDAGPFTQALCGLLELSSDKPGQSAQRLRRSVTQNLEGFWNASSHCRPFPEFRRGSVPLFDDDSLESPDPGL